MRSVVAGPRPWSDRPGPSVTAEAVVFRVADPDGRLRGVRLRQETQRPREGPAFDRDGTDWVLHWPRPPVDRLEYLLVFERLDGGTETRPDPANPRRAPGPFGDRSVVEFPGYEAPHWLDDDEPRGGELLNFPLASRTLGGVLPLLLWTSRAGDDGPLPLLVVHDGPEMDRFGDLLCCCARMVAAGRLPPHRVALVGPVDRNETYACSPAYVRALARELWPLLSWLAPTPAGQRPAALGVSLGGLALLHAQRARPELLGGLCLQSASSFRATDVHERDFPRFRRIARFVAEVERPDLWVHTVPVTLTCGAVEENLGGNRAVAEALHRQGYDVALHERPDAHNWVAWRDAWDPHLVDLLARSWA